MKVTKENEFAIQHTKELLEAYTKSGQSLESGRSLIFWLAVTALAHPEVFDE